MSESDDRILRSRVQRIYKTGKKPWHSCKCQTTANVSEDKDKEAAGIVEVPENMVIAYVDGSFEKSIGRYAFGCVILTPAGEEFRKSGSGCDPEGVKIRNVAGEMLGAMNAVQWAKRA